VAVQRVRSGDAWVVGDVHGKLEETVALLNRAGFLDDSESWGAGTAQLWFIGDLTDRGPHGLEVIDLVMRLQREAAARGGAVQCLMGNHDIFLLAARRFLDSIMPGGGISFRALWEMNGGQDRDLEGLTADHLSWLASLPFVARVGSDLLIHADSTAYLELGSTIEEIDACGRAIVTGDDLEAWSDLARKMVRRNELWDDGPEGDGALHRLLTTFEVERIVHGHTPIPLIDGRPPEEVTEPLVYSSGRAVNVDGGMFLGSPGIALRLLSARG
jgi:hypothetical protein